MNPDKIFGARVTVEQVEEGTELAPKFDAHGLIPAVTTDYTSGELLMHGYMNAEALTKTIETGEAHYFSRSRQAIWHKGATSGLTQVIRELKIDDDQDCVWLRVDVGGSGAHLVGGGLLGPELLPGPVGGHQVGEGAARPPGGGWCSGCL